jgi:hypothetical protein
MYWTLDTLATWGRRLPAGLIHLPLLPSMVAASATDEPSMDLQLMRRAVEVALGVVVGARGTARRGRPLGSPGRRARRGSAPQRHELPER